MASPVAASSSPVLRMEGIVKRFAGVTALDGVELQLPAGRVFRPLWVYLYSHTRISDRSWSVSTGFMM